MAQGIVNPFVGMSTDELALAYVQFSESNDREAVEWVCEAYDEDTYVDLRTFDISTRDFK